MKKKQIFIIEDDAVTARLISEILLKFNFNVTGIADNRDDALEKIKEAIPDLILIDIDLNDNINGIDIAKIIKELYNIPILYVTGHANFEIIESARKTNPYGYVLKPVSPIALYSAIDSALNQHRIKKERDIALEDFRRIFDLSLDIICVLNKKGYLTKINPAAENILGYSINELLSKPYIEFIHPDDRKNTLKIGQVTR